VRRKTDRKGETTTLALVLAAIVGPMFLTGALIAIDMRTDLSGLKARPGADADGFRAVGWGELEALAPGQRMPARMLGYMMDGYKPAPDGTPVETFMLMPDAGHLLHPAHREPEDMVEVWMPLDSPVRYSDRRLIWVSGMLRRKEAKPREGVAAFTLSDAEVRFAAERQIRDWFVP
jgi:hypothetical protein